MLIWPIWKIVPRLDEQWGEWERFGIWVRVGRRTEREEGWRSYCLERSPFLCRPVYQLERYHWEKRRKVMVDRRVGAIRELAW